jgi:hypothetical protein
MHTQTHVFYNRSNGYNSLNTAHVRSLTVAEILIRDGLEGLPWVQIAKLTSFQACLVKFFD